MNKSSIKSFFKPVAVTAKKAEADDAADGVSAVGNELKPTETENEPLSLGKRKIDGLSSSVSSSSTSLEAEKSADINSDTEVVAVETFSTSWIPVEQLQ